MDLYERLGFIRYKRNIPGTNQGYVVPMVGLIHDAEHLRAVRSPFLKTCLAHRPCAETAEWFDRTFPGLREAATQHLVAPDDFWKEWVARMERVASVIAETEQQVLVISQEFLQRAMKALPEIATRLLYNLNAVLSDKLCRTTSSWLDAQGERDRASMRSQTAERGRDVA